jgi:hypothetical protein
MVIPFVLVFAFLKVAGAPMAALLHITQLSITEISFWSVIGLSPGMVLFSLSLAYYILL